MPQQNKKISFIQAAGIIGFAIVMDLFQWAGEWAITFLITTIGTTLTFGLGAAPSIAVGMGMGAAFGLFLSTFTGIGLSWMFYRLQVPFAGKLGAATIIEIVPFLNMLPAWTLAATVTVMSANGSSIGGLVSSGLSVIGGAAVAGATARAVTPARAPVQSAARQEALENKQNTRQTRAANAPLQIDGIRSANDNTITRYPKAA